MAHRAHALLSLGVIAVAISAASHSEAADSGSGATYDSSSVNYEPPATKRRGGFAFGVTSGVGVGSYRGYPLEVEALNDPGAQKRTGPAFSNQITAWIGGTPRDFLTLGLGVTAASGSGDERGVLSGFVFHVEAYPFFYRGGVFEDLGFSFDGGLGIGLMSEADAKNFDDPSAEGGAMSTLSAGVFWEPLRFWNISAGPAVTYLRAFSQTMNVDQISFGFRGALYSDQPKPAAGAEIAFGGP